jgi:hypothetical protein
MTVLAGLLILAAILIAAALAVLGTIAAATEIFPPRFGWGNEAVSARVSPSRPRAALGPVAGVAHARLSGDPRRGQKRIPTRIGMKSQ